MKSFIILAVVMIILVSIASFVIIHNEKDSDAGNNCNYGICELPE